LLTPFKSLMAMNTDCHVSLRGFFKFLFYFLKCSHVNPACHVSKSMFYIQFDPYICYFCSI